MQYRPLPRAHRIQADYSQWSIEELWQLAAQMRVTGARSQQAVRSGDWKLLFDGRPLLFNVRTDLGEHTNLIETRGDIARRLAPLLAAWQRDVDDEAKRAGAR